MTTSERSTRVEHADTTALSRAGAWAGVAAPMLFLTGLALASRWERSFMDGYDWSIWPAGLALGPNGWLWAVSSVLLGALLLCFAWAVVWRGVTRTGGALLGGAGVGALLFAFTTDLQHQVAGASPIGAHTTSGQVHGVGFVVCLPCLAAGSVVLWRAARRLPGWRDSRRWAAVSLVLVLPALTLPAERAVAGCLTQVIVLSPLTALAARLARLSIANRNADAPGTE